ncbi:hypothetical protein FKW77_010590 [Venturia effusa]|uniref:Uncharacterized protein n=1 Tax=Venturia effusa TaxID=50376 RepID=A0A517KXW5_9PEZI|nr:hypothetical protein FKW77_010590 [Venturia effusa]
MSTYTRSSSSTSESPVLPSTTSSNLYPSSKSYGYDDPSTTSSASSIHYYDDPSSGTPSKPTVTSKPHRSYDDPSYTSTAVYTTTLTTTYIDICETGLTTVTATYKTTICPGSTTPAVPSGWTTTVTVCQNCGPKPTTVTITKPFVTSTAVEIVTLVVKPVPQKEYTATLLSTPVVVVKATSSVPVVPAKSMPAAPAKVAPSHPVVASGDAASSTPVKPVLASSPSSSSSGYPIKKPSSSSSPSSIAPVKTSPSPISSLVQTHSAKATGNAVPTGSKTGSPAAAQFTGAAAGRVHVGASVLGGLVVIGILALL